MKWSKALQPLIEQYRDRPHPLEYKNIYQLLVMVVLSARDSDKNINALAPVFFKKYKNIKTLAAADPAELNKLLLKVRSGKQKGQWLLSIAQEVKSDKNIPLTMEGLVALKGIGRKSANVIMREAGVPAEGIMVDLHVQRVVPRLGITQETDAKKMEEVLMNVLPQKDWSEAGMALSYLGRETCRPSHPEHADCVMKKHCAYYKLKMKD